MKENGFERYSAIMRYLREKCKELKPVAEVMGPIVGTNEKTCKYYILENGLHVYVRNETVWISDGEVEFFKDGIRETKTSELCIMCTEDEVNCLHYAEDGMAHSLLKYTTPELDPKSAEELEDEKEESESESKNAKMPRDMEDAMCQSRVDISHPDLYQRVIEINKKLRVIEIEQGNAQALTALGEIKNELEQLKHGDKGKIRAIAERLSCIAQEIQGDTAAAQELRKEIEEILNSIGETGIDVIDKN